LNKRIFRERMRHLGGREVFAFSPQPIAEVDGLPGKIHWSQMVVFPLESLFERGWLSGITAFIWLFRNVTKPGV